jgi:chemotaxis protein methyltransferase CheR
MEARLLDRVAATTSETTGGYLDLIESHGGRAELELLLEALRVGETRFFRHRAHVAAMSETVIPWLRKRGGGRVRAWSAGCATGEEAYTLAMVLAKELPTEDWSLEVLATDISKLALDTAERRSYSESSLAKVPNSMREWAFGRADDGRFRIADHIASLVSFEERSLSDGRFPSDVDIIWCRNVLIYFTPQAKGQAIKRLIGSLSEGGFLFVGYSESLRDFAKIQRVRSASAVLYRKDSARRSPVAREDLTPVPQIIRRPQSASGTPRPKRVTRPADAELTIALRGRYDDAVRLTAELSPAMEGTHRRVVVLLDGAEFLDDAVATVFRRAQSAARTAGVELELVARRSGIVRWLERCGLSSSEESQS